MSRRISILGSTGSIGVNALEVIAGLGDEYQFVALTSNTRWELLVKQAQRWCPEAVCIVDETHAEEVKRALSPLSIAVFSGRSGLLDLASRPDVDLMLNALVGSAGMEPTYRAVSAGVNVALSNKESLVMAGEIITAQAKKFQAEIFPVDSEHSAIWQCLAGESRDDVHRVILTGSGGPFRTRPMDTFSAIRPADALKHPNWDMGNKITIDSATMMNKGLEIIEAHWLFGLPLSRIDVVIHPQSVVHSMVEFRDGSVKAQLGIPDMKVPIQYALTYPQHRDSNWKRLDLVEYGELTFSAPDYRKFPCIKLATKALEKGGSAPAAMNWANDKAVALFLTERIRFTDIPDIIEKAVARHEFISAPNLTDLAALEKWIDDFIANYLKEISV